MPNDDRERVQHAVDRLAPRGPDGEGFWSDEFCALGHRRLAIIDLSPAGSQPMAAFGYIITFNGEIFNFPQLRADLEERGHQFTSRSDTEVLLAGWREWGEGVLHRISGMFAFALWDPRTQELIIARDRFGEKPLFYWSECARLAFASTFSGLEIVAGRRFPLDPVALRLLFAMRYIPEPRTIGQNARKLPAGHLLRFSQGSVEVRRWYAGGDVAQAPIIRVPDAVTAMRDAVDAAVADRLVADVPVGAFLSGGIDSAIIAASMVHHGGIVRTFTIGFNDGPQYYEERPQARRVAEHLGTDHTEIVLDARSAHETLDQVFAGLDEPFGDSSAVAAFIISRAARCHVKVALSGDGADEVFGGYRKYQGELYAAFYAGLPRPFREGLIEPVLARMPEDKAGRILERLRRLKRFVSVAGGDSDQRHAGWLRQLSEHELAEFLGPRGEAPTVESIVMGLRSRHLGLDTISAALAIDIDLVLAGDMFVKVDRMSMANGLEVRCPFLDQRVVEAAFRLPGSMRLRPRAGKWILRQAFADRLPGEVFRRPKKGFEIPIAEWLRGPMLDRVRHATDPDRLRRQGLFAPHVPAAWLTQLQTKRRDTSWALWTLIAFQEWARTHDRPEAIH
jgi:asparagine synthase (glutamine-hydrolysing)